MDRKSKLVIVGLIVVAVLFFIGLGAGLALNDGGEPEPSEYKPDAWIDVMAGLLAPFGPVLDVNRLESNCQRSAKTFLLTKTSSSCKIRIPPADERYRKATLRVNEGVELRVAVFEEKKPTATRGTVMQLQAVPTFKLQLKNQVKVQPKASKVKLTVKYIPEGESERVVSRWVSPDPFRLTVLELGGVLKLDCADCTVGGGRTVKVVLE